MTPIDVAQYAGVVLGLCGAVLVSGASRRSRQGGFAMWIGSNVCLITWAIHAQAWGLLTMYAVYSATSIMGWWNNRDRERPQGTTSSQPGSPA